MVLPPFLGEEPGDSAQMSPYPTSMVELVQRYATSPERIAILRGLISYRSRLRELGYLEGQQWLDGSFVEDVEAIRRRPPQDIDIVTFAAVPGTQGEKMQHVLENLDIFDPGAAKAQYLCDAYFVDLTVAPLLLVDTTRYWFGLFSHQRETSLWKGMLQVQMLSDDDAAVEMLNNAELNLGVAQNAQEA